MNTSFKERVAQIANEQAKIYKSVYVDYEYLLCSNAFTHSDYYIIAATPKNYKHLIGVNSPLSPEDFYDKCLASRLSPTDFDFVKKNQSEKDVKGSVRRKIKALPAFNTMITKDLVAQERFVKNKVVCSFATTDAAITAGFIDAGKARPKTLLSGDEIDWSKADSVDLILRKKVGEPLFTDILVGSHDDLLCYYPKIKNLISDQLTAGLNLSGTLCGSAI